MEAVRIFGVCFLIGLGLALAIPAACKGMYLQGFGFLLAGLFAGATALFIEAVVDGTSFVAFPILGLIFTVVSFAGVATSSHVFMARESEAQRDLLDLFIRIQVWADDVEDRERAVIEAGTRACQMQTVFDLQTVVIDVFKALYFTPGLTLVDGAVNAIYGTKSTRCLDYYFKLKDMKPDYVRGFERRNPWIVGAERPE